MKKLFIVDGAMRPAKNELVRHLTKLEKNLSGGHFSNVCLARKYSTKDGGIDQDYEQKENLETIIDNDKRQYISYTYENSTYGLEKKYLDDLIERHENVFLLIGSTELVFELKQKYSKHNFPVKVVTVYVYSDKKTIEDSYKCQESNQPSVPLPERQKRLEKADNDYENAMAMLDQYDETIIYNKKDGCGSGSLAIKINALIAKYRNTIKPYSIFLIHSFCNEVNNAGEIYRQLQKAAEGAFGDECSTVCTSLINGKGSYKIGDTIWDALETNDYIICDITPDRRLGCDASIGTSPNIWIELGYALCVMRSRNIKIGQRLIITCKTNESVKIKKPTDINDLNIVYYKDYDEFSIKIAEHLKKLKDN
ncbi:MAG: hypothetical protein LBI42_10760 [Chitinispirillales bacterium]|jgi:hypothetical protein|nr:hypothetical protein [Chitinispirillales bacterium]